MELSTIFSEKVITYIILAFSAYFFMKGKIRADFVALSSMLLLLLTGVLDPMEALSGFSNTVVIMMAGLFVVGAGIFRTGLAKMISSRLMSMAGKNENVLFVLIMVVTAGIGAFVSNTGTVAVMMPIVMSMAANANINPRRYLMPLAFASSMGLFTLISTPPNLVIYEELIHNGFPAISFFSFAPIGFICLIIGTILLFFLSKWLIIGESKNQNKSNKARSLEDLVLEYQIQQDSIKVFIPEDSVLAGKTLAESGIRNIHNVSVFKIVKEHKRQIIGRKIEEHAAGPNSIISGGSVIYCTAEKEDLDKFIKFFNLEIIPKNEEDYSFNFQETGVAEAYVFQDSMLINKTLSECNFRERYGVNVLGVKRNQDYLMTHLPQLKLAEGDALLIEGTWEKLSSLDNSYNDLVMVGQPLEEASKITLDQKAPLAAFIMLAMIVLLVTNIIPAVAAVLLAAGVMIASGCLRNMEEAYTSINWSSLILIAAMMPMATAFEKTGITTNIATFLNDNFGNMGPLALLAGVYVATSILTLFVSNTATAVLFAPIAMKSALVMGISPQPYMYAVAVAASMCFASPFSTPPNALVMNAGNYSFADYVKVGLPLQIIMAVIMIFSLPLLFPF